MTSDTELTVEELAATVGMTVRNIRAYTSRGLLPPPRLRGRTGLYGPEHVSRLRLVQQMLADGYTLAAVERVLARAPQGVTGPALDLHRALVTPFLPEDPEEVEVATLALWAGTDVDPSLLDRLEELAVLERLPGDRVRVLAPSLLRAGLQVVALGIPPDAVVEAQTRVTQHLVAAAEIYVELFRRAVWRPFADAGEPEEELPRISAAVERVQPAASQAVLAAFRIAMAQVIERALGEERAARDG